jgi:hypothetical protein
MITSDDNKNHKTTFTIQAQRITFGPGGQNLFPEDYIPDPENNMDCQRYHTDPEENIRTRRTTYLPRG